MRVLSPLNKPEVMKCSGTNFRSLKMLMTKNIAIIEEADFTVLASSVTKRLTDVCFGQRSQMSLFKHSLFYVIPCVDTCSGDLLMSAHRRWAQQVPR